MFSKLNILEPRVLRRSIYIEPVLNIFADLFLEFIHVFRFCQTACFLIYIETAQNYREERNEFADLLF